MYEILCDSDKQKKRCDRVAKVVAEYVEKYVSTAGEWSEKYQNMAWREQLYFALAFLRSGMPDAVRKANLVIQKGVPNRCHFAPMIALQILTKYDGLLEQESRECLCSYVKEHMHEFVGDDLDYLGVNDNFPSLATYTLVIGGQFLKRPELSEQGKERLKHFKQLLTRRGVASEYNSPTYSPIQLLAMAELASHAADGEIRRTALECEHRIWADVLGHLHMEASQVAGPFSRAYADDSAGYASQASGSLYALLGDALPVNIFNTILESEDGCKDGYFHNGPALGQVDILWIMDTVYSCPEELLELALHKQYPYEISATTEFTSSTDAAPSDEVPAWAEGELANYEYPAGTGRIYTYMTKDYALGTATHEFHNGIQTDSFHLLYRRKIPVKRQKDIGTVYARYLVNEKQPAKGMVLLEDDGRKLGIQHQNTAMMLYKPKPFLQKSVHSLKLSLVIPRLDETIGELWLGDCRMEGRSIESGESCSVFIRDGSVYMAFHPLLLTDHGRRHAVTAEWLDGFLLVSFYNYSGAARDFGMREMLLTGNGFVAEISSQEESGSFEAFRKAAGEFSIRDEWQSTIHSRYSTIRKTSFQKKDLCIACEYSPVTEGIKQISVNGQPLPEEKLHITGFDCSVLPFLN